MGASNELYLFLKMKKSEYMAIDEKTRQMHLNSKIYSESPADFNELMTDKTYSDLYVQNKKIRKQLEERQYQLREARRKNEGK